LRPALAIRAAVVTVAGALVALGTGALRPDDRHPDVVPEVDTVRATARALRATPRVYAPDFALGIVVGYAFADGEIAGGTYTYDQGGEGLGDQFRAAIIDAGGTVQPRGAYAARSQGLPDLGLVHHGPLTARILTGSENLRRGVLTGIIQCEGGIDGLVWDNPSRPVSQSVVDLLATFGISAELRGRSFFSVYVGPPDFPFFQALPVAVKDRVPGSPPPAPPA
jgi:hypothetical protein